MRTSAFGRSLAFAFLIVVLAGPLAEADMPGLLRYWGADWSNFTVDRPFMYKAEKKFGLFLNKATDLKLINDDTRVLWIKSRDLLTEDVFKQLNGVIGDKGLVIDESLDFSDQDAKLFTLIPNLKYLDIELQTPHKGGTSVAANGISDDGVINGITKLHDLVYLGVSAGRLTLSDRGVLEGVVALTNLTCLDLGPSLDGAADTNQVKVTAHGIVDGILRMKKLKRLNLTHVSLVSNRAIAELATMQNLTHLRLDGGANEKTFLDGVSKLHSLTHLDCRFVGLTDRAVIEGIAPLPALTHLNMLFCGRATDLSAKAYTEKVGGMTNLVFLGVAQTRLDDGGGVNGIARLTGLKYLDIAATKGSEKGFGTLRNALPHTVINRNPFFDESNFNDWWNK